MEVARHRSTAPAHLVRALGPLAEVFAGIDWGGAFHQVCLIDEYG
jgi:hypothetical protein